MTWLLGAVKGIFSVIWGYVAAGVGVLLSVFAVYRSGKSAGVNEVVVKTKEKEVENAKTANEVRRDVATTSPDDVDKRLRKFRRD